MKITVLADNNTFIDMYYLGEPALSFFIEDEGRKILFDTGYSDVFLKNAEKMGIDLCSADQIVLSHGHNDHSGGLQYLMKKKKGMPLLCHPGTFVYRQDDEGLAIGSPLDKEEVMKNFQLTCSEKPVQISEHLFYLGQIEERLPFEKRYAIGKAKDGETMDEDFIFDDSALACKGKDGIFIITGCSHAGICNIIEQAKRILNDDRIIGVIGGFHLFDTDERLEKTISYLKENGIGMLYPCHCVSLAAKIAMAKELAIHEVGVGLFLEIE